MSAPRQDALARIQAQSREVRQLAAQLDSRERTILVTDLLRAVYDSVKFDNPEGGGLDGRDGPERSSLGKLVDASLKHARKVLDARDADQGTAGSRL